MSFLLSFKPLVTKPLRKSLRSITCQLYHAFPPKVEVAIGKKDQCRPQPWKIHSDLLLNILHYIIILTQFCYFIFKLIISILTFFLVTLLCYINSIIYDLLLYFFNIYHCFNHHLCICHSYVFIYHQLLNCPLSELALKLPTFHAFRVKVNQRLIIQNSVLIFSIPTWTSKIRPHKN